MVEIFVDGWKFHQIDVPDHCYIKVQSCGEYLEVKDSLRASPDAHEVKYNIELNQTLIFKSVRIKLNQITLNLPNLFDAPNHLII